MICSATLHGWLQSTTTLPLPCDPVRVSQCLEISGMNLRIFRTHLKGKPKPLWSPRPQNTTLIFHHAVNCGACVRKVVDKGHRSLREELEEAGRKKNSLDTSHAHARTVHVHSHYVTLRYSALYCAIVYCTALHFTSLHCTRLYYSTLHYTSTPLHVVL